MRIFHDEAVLAINKPSGLLTHRGWANDRETALSVARELRERFGLHRLALHAERLAFTHPRSRQRIVVHAPMTEDLAAPLRAMDLLADVRPHGATVPMPATNFGD